jgi:hypothetical protein
MAAESPTPETSPESQEPKKKRENIASQIEFPYGHLDEAIALVKVIAENGGAYGCEPANVVGWLGTTITSGAFRGKLSTARIFGLLITGHLKITLTDLGRRIVDPPQERSARVEAFLHVPLYQAIYEKTKGFPLPNNVGLESLIVDLGVSPKQKDKARQAFQRSAEQAGFFEHGKNRLVIPLETGPRPVPTPASQPTIVSPTTDPPRLGNSGGDDGLPPLDPILKGLILRIPPAGSVWPMDQRQKWLATAENIFGLVFLDEPMAR